MRRVAPLKPGQMASEYPECEASMTSASDHTYEKLLRILLIGSPAEEHIDATLRAGHQVQKATGFTLPASLDVVFSVLREFASDKLPED